MVQKLDFLKETPSQTAGPYVHIGTNPNWVEITGVWNEDLGLVLVGPETKGERIIVKGRIFDGAGDVLRDALVEIWQADAEGLYNSPEETRGKADPNFVGWGRQPCDGTTGEYRFETVKPGRVPFRDGRMMAPPPRLGAFEKLGAWLHIWTPPRGAIVPPPPRRGKTTSSRSSSRFRDSASPSSCT